MIDAPPLILAVDDEPTNLRALQNVLGDEFELVFATDGERALQLAAERQPALILLDVVMGPGPDGYEVCRRLKADPATARIPVIFVTVLSETENEAEGFDAGAVDYINKPIRPPVVRARVRTHLSLVHADELRAAQLELVQRLGRAAEFKTDERSGHIVRMSHYSSMLARAVGASEAWATDLNRAAPLHDVGKIGVPDRILNKPTRLDAEEWQIVRKHPEMGASILGHATEGMLGMATRIALQHHERWDGTGYPNRLSREGISIEARIVAIADVFDALTTRRAYKQPWSIDDSIGYIRSNAGTHFDPHLAEAFVTQRPAVEQIHRTITDQTATV